MQKQTLKEVQNAVILITSEFTGNKLTIKDLELITESYPASINAETSL
jgi:hypothetical protein